MVVWEIWELFGMPGKPVKASQGPATFELCFDLWLLKDYLSKREADFHGENLPALNSMDTLKGGQTIHCHPHLALNWQLKGQQFQGCWVQPKALEGLFPLLSQRTGNPYFLPELWIDLKPWGLNLSLKIQEVGPLTVLMTWQLRADWHHGEAFSEALWGGWSMVKANFFAS